MEETGNPARRRYKDPGGAREKPSFAAGASRRNFETDGREAKPAAHLGIPTTVRAAGILGRPSHFREDAEYHRQLDGPCRRIAETALPEKGTLFRRRSLPWSRSGGAGDSFSALRRIEESRLGRRIAALREGAESGAGLDSGRAGDGRWRAGSKFRTRPSTVFRRVLPPWNCRPPSRLRRRCLPPRIDRRRRAFPSRIRDRPGAVLHAASAQVAGPSIGEETVSQPEGNPFPRTRSFSAPGDFRSASSGGTEGRHARSTGPEAA